MVNVHRIEIVVTACVLCCASMATGLGGTICLIIEDQKLTLNEPDPTEAFGLSVAVSGDTAVMSVRQENQSGQILGTFFVFTRTGDIWTQDQQFSVSGTTTLDIIGQAIAIEGDTIMVSGLNFFDLAGEVVVFTLENGTWTEMQTLAPAELSSADAFGTSVAFSGDTAVIGAEGDDDAGDDAGAVYLFERIGGVWTHVDKLTASDGDVDGRFGSAAAIEGDRMVVGARGDNGANAGAAYIFDRVAGVWSETQKLLASDGAAGDLFGNQVAIDGDNVIVAAQGDTGQQQGSAYIFTLDAGVWTEAALLEPTEDFEPAGFGKSVAIDGNFAFVGAPESRISIGTGGRVYAYQYDGGTWSQYAQLVGSDALELDQLGESIAFAGDVVLAGATGPLHAPGAVYVLPLDCPVVGDLDDDLDVDGDDHSLFCSTIGSSVHDRNFNPAADLNHDGEIDELDLVLFNEVIMACLGDVVTSATATPPGDGVVDAADLAFLLGAWSDEPSCADFVTGDTFQPPPDGSVDGADLAYLLGAWGACE